VLLHPWRVDTDSMSDTGPEPDGWELLRALDSARTNGRRELENLRRTIEERFVPGDTIREVFKTIDDRLDAIEKDFIPREASAAADKMLEDRITDNANRIVAGQERLTERVDHLEKKKEESAQFRRTMLIAVMTSVIAAASTVIITIIHLYG
jgi:CHASE3 domain sensor protein